ncbi:phosphoribosylanthranilate isomerase [Paenibacillus thermoaerophilus]|uniref:N-(5'-phosphoribosyl)anthranilate isomerase n=1 Tax=Paenibacillus thermoaerophilus TaxID=1215385 RepID=A0ABW2V781_9BACL|nr:phosphoribosylanthranilate isomerase [Paenibacillus thermoaerophilus]TMV18699.1 phosphoribosylanthranilate isomerase [Paenibacillus thermoaerophilus]
MSGPIVKICGLQRGEVIQSIEHLLIDWIGFVLAPSRRRVTPERAGELIANMRSSSGPLRDASAVGVFVNPGEEELRSTMRSAPLDIIQLHGRESPAFCNWVRTEFPGVRVMKVVSFASGRNRDDAVLESPEGLLGPYEDAVDYLLLDTHDPVYGGGSGQTFNWEMIPEYRDWARARGIPLLVAGGLTPDNVGHLMERYAPDGVDVSSGVETDGQKDSEKIRLFVERVKARV